jgi:hypothetical protein
MAAPLAPQDQLRRARAERGEDLETLSARTGLRVHHVRAIEEGRFGDLPPGIYGRAAIRSFATAYALDADAVVAACEPLLAPVVDPIGAMARMRGVAGAAEAEPSDPSPAMPSSPTSWRSFVAVGIDAALAGVLLCLVAGGAALLVRVPVSALSPAVASLSMIGLLFGGASYVWLAGLAGTTLGEYAVGWAPPQRDPRPLTLGAIVRRARAAATADARAILDAGAWVGRRLRAEERSVPPPVPLPSPPRLHDREELLTWSMSRRASVPPPPRHPLHD